MFENIESKVFDDPEFKEDSVRELVIAPIFTRHGYLPSGSTRVTRTKSLRLPPLCTIPGLIQQRYQMTQTKYHRMYSNSETRL